jgi:hypothetical protein
MDVCTCAVDDSQACAYCRAQPLPDWLENASTTSIMRRLGGVSVKDMLERWAPPVLADEPLNWRPSQPFGPIATRVHLARVEAWRRSGAYRNDQSPSNNPKPHLRLRCAVVADGGLCYAVEGPGWRTPAVGSWWAHCAMAIQEAGARYFNHDPLCLYFDSVNGVRYRK